LLRDFIVICDQTNNTSQILSEKKFILSIKIKFTPFSEVVDMFFINVAQTTEISGSGA